MQELFAFFSLVQDLTRWFFDWLPILIWAVPAVAGCIFLTIWLGPKFSLPAFIAVAGAIFFKIGEKIGRDNMRKRDKDIQLKREKAYEKIDRRGTSVRDVLERLRNNKF